MEGSGKVEQGGEDGGGAEEGVGDSWVVGRRRRRQRKQAGECEGDGGEREERQSERAGEVDGQLGGLVLVGDEQWQQH